MKEPPGEKRLTGAVFLDVAKAFDTLWIDGLLYKLTLLTFPSYIINTDVGNLRHACQVWHVERFPMAH